VTVTVPAYPLRCGRPFGQLRIVFPTSARVPAEIAARAVTFDGTAVGAVQVSGRTVAVTPRSMGVTCHSISVGSLQIHFARSVGLTVGQTNGARVAVWRGPRRFAATVTVVA
jgi:hypothetical protein